MLQSINCSDISTGYVSNAGIAINSTDDWTPISAVNISSPSIEEEVKRVLNDLGGISNLKADDTVRKEEKKVELFKNFNFGSVKDGSVRLSPYGLAVKNLEGTWVTYDQSSDSVKDVDVFSFDAKNFVFKVPAAPKDVRAGDVIVHQGKAMFVVSDVCEGDTCASVIDVRAGESKEILFTKNLFGFDFLTKIVSILDTSSLAVDIGPNNPFGNMWMFALMDNKDFDMATMMLMTSMNKNGTMGNIDPMMLAFAMSGDKGDNSMMLPLLMMSMGKSN